MTLNGKENTEERLTLQGRLSEIAQVPIWLERLAARYAIPDNVQFASNLCLEEVLSNIILHSYNAEKDGTIVVRFAARDGNFVFVIDDEGPRFNPLDQPELPALNPNEEMRIGGQGLRLLREFSDTLEYEQIPTGNRLKIGFSAAGSHDSSGPKTN